MANIRTLDLNLLKVFDVLLDERSVTRAADRLALSQPAVSGMLKRLRDSFDDPLFIRTQHGILPSNRALELAEPVKRALAEVEGMLQPKVFEPSNADLTLTISATDYGLQAVVLPFIHSLRELAPGIRVSALAQNDAQMAGMFERGLLDLALITPETRPPDLHAHYLYDERYVCALRKGHPDAKGDKLSLDRFCALDHVLMSYIGGAFRGATDKALEQLGRNRRVVLSVPSFLVLAKVLRSSDLIAVVPERLFLDDPTLVLMEPPVDILGFTKIAAWHERTHRDLGHQWARNLLFDSFCSANKGTPEPV